MSDFSSNLVNFSESTEIQASVLDANSFTRKTIMCQLLIPVIHRMQFKQSEPSVKLKKLRGKEELLKVHCQFVKIEGSLPTKKTGYLMTSTFTPTLPGLLVTKTIYTLL